MAILQHPNICTIYDAGQYGDQAFIAMEFIEGSELSSLIKSGVPLGEARIIEFCSKVANACMHAHSKGIVHRDLKPSNIMVGASGEPKLMDFGLAKCILDDDETDLKLTHEGAILGTPTYMSPEQVLGDQTKIGPATDVFSLGIILYELLTGQLPYRGTLGMIVGQILSGSVPNPELVLPGMNKQLASICRKALAKKPEDRFSDMSNFSEALSGLSNKTLPSDFQERPASELPAGNVASKASKDWKSSNRILAKRSSGSTWQRGALFLVGVVALLLFGGVAIRMVSNHGTSTPGTSTKEALSLEEMNERERDIESPRSPTTRGESETIEVTNTPPPAIAPFDAKAALGHQEAWSKHLRIPVEYTNSIGMKFRLIPPGEFALHPQVKRAVQPGPNVIQQPFYAGVHEVTVGQFREFVKATGYRTTAERDGKGAVRVTGLGRLVERAPLTTWKHSDLASDDQMAVGCLTWFDATSFCSWLSAKEKKSYRLPLETEAVWISRAGSAELYFFGEDPASAPEYAWFSTNESPIDRPQIVGKKKANAWGLFDVYGNVSELCSDWLTEKGARRASLATASDGPDIHDGWIHRGGGYPDLLHQGETGAIWGMGFSHIGFRVLLEANSPIR